MSAENSNLSSLAGRRAVLTGNQNSGKTTLFNYMTGADQYVGNWPGVTVDHVTGRVDRLDLKLTDLPGLYSMSPYSPEEVVSRRFLLNCEYDVIVNVVDAAHLERSLSLTAELLKFNRPMVVALNMIDLARKNNVHIDTAALSRRLGVQVVPICAATGEGVSELYEAMVKAEAPTVKVYGEEVESAIADLASLLESKGDGAGFVTESELPAGEKCACGGCCGGGKVTREAKSDTSGRFDFIALSLLQGDREFHDRYRGFEDVLSEVLKLRKRIEDHCSGDMESLVAGGRYAFVDSVIKECQRDGGAQATTGRLSQKIDNIVTDRFLAIPIFALIVYCVYYLAVSTVGTWGTDYANDVIFGEYVTNFANSVLESAAAPEWLSGLVVDGIIGGVGAVLGFVPQMIVLFILLSLLEQSGYMTRVAFVLDRIFRHFGLSGRGIIPMVVATGCGVPALMATNTIDNINEKRITVITTTFMPCSAKLPILAMIAAAFFPESTLVAPGVYFGAIFSIAFSSLILKKNSAFKEDVSPFIMEMPDYTMPKLRNVLSSTYERCRAFVVKAGTIIFSTVVVIWFLSSFNFTADGFGMTEVNDSMLAAIGSSIAFIFVPLGFASWQAAVAVFTGLLAKENVVGTMAVLLGLGSEVTEDDASLGAALQGEFTLSSAALAFLIFNLFSTPCIAALGAMKRQLGSNVLFAKAVVFLLGYAYALSFVFYNLYGLATGELAFSASSIVAIAVLAGALFLAFRPERKDKPSLVIRARQM